MEGDYKRCWTRMCILSPRLFNLHNKMIMREADTQELGVAVGGREVSNITGTQTTPS